ncbi:hypothetical protein VNO80_04487 [Phaseolus coccineus]|uniref:Uncharacterized protein n=1 Tax=Phaseolus coccineus TaxID=3886 RepID=A0AAN9NTH8_PHACN
MYKLCKAKTICLDSPKILPIPFYLFLVVFLLSLCDVQIMSTECKLYSWIFDGHIVVVESFEVNREKGVSDFSLLQVHTHSDTTKEQGGLICTRHKKTEGLVRVKASISKSEGVGGVVALVATICKRECDISEQIKIFNTLV